MTPSGNVPGVGSQGKGRGKAWAWGLRHDEQKPGRGFGISGGNENKEGTGVVERYYWNEENRLVEAEINGQRTYFLYDASGERTIKRGQHGENLYVDKNYQIQNRAIVTKHIFVGESRVVSRLSHTDYLDRDYEKKNVYFYYPDHLSSTTFVADPEGEEFEHLEYTPYGESWVDEGTNKNIIGYKFTSKELDTETGLYTGARYLNPQTCRRASPELLPLFRGP